MSKKIITGLDIGSTKIGMIVGECNNDNETQVIGVAEIQSEGIRKGMVENIRKTIDSIKKVKDKVSKMSGCVLGSSVVAIGGPHIEGINNTGMVKIKKGEVTEEDVKRVIDAASAYHLPPDRMLLHVIPQQYIIDGNDGIEDPVGISGVRLDVNVHLVTASRSAVENIRKCVESCDIEITGIIAQTFASSFAVLDDNEKELGTALINMGGGTTEVSVWYNKGLHHTSVIPVGGNNITHDIAIGLGTPIREAEELKLKCGCALSQLIEDSETIDVPGVGGRPAVRIKRHELTKIIEPTMQRIFELISREIQKTGFEDILAGGVVITGGSSLLDGIIELGEETLKLRTRIGIPTEVKGLGDLITSPAYSTLYGLLLFQADYLNKKLMFPATPYNVPKKSGKVISLLKKAVNFLF